MTTHSLIVTNWYFDEPMTGKRTWYDNYEECARNLYHRQFLDGIYMGGVKIHEIKVEIAKYEKHQQSSFNSYWPYDSDDDSFLSGEND